MKNVTQKPGSANAATWRWQSYANVYAFGRACLLGMNPIPAHTVFNRCDSLTPIYWGPMT
jgi:hypothetical protein